MKAQLVVDEGLNLPLTKWGLKNIEALRYAPAKIGWRVEDVPLVEAAAAIVKEFICTRDPRAICDVVAKLPTRRTLFVGKISDRSTIKCSDRHVFPYDNFGANLQYVVE